MRALDEFNSNISIVKDFNRNVAWLKSQQLQKEKKKTWVTAHKLAAITNWSKERMRGARLSNDIEFKKIATGGYRYNICSLDPIFLKTQQL